MNSRSLALLTAGLLGTLIAPAFALSPVLSPMTTAAAPQITPNFPALTATRATNSVTRLAQRDENSQKFTWSAEKTADSITLAGSTPNSAIKSFLTVRAGQDANDQMSVTTGGPDDFVGNSLAGLAALSGLTTGRVAYANGRWTLTGYAGTETALDSLVSTLENAVEIADWDVFVEVATPGTAVAQAPEPAPAAPVGTAEPLLKWSVSRSADGEMTLGGMVHTAALQSYLRVRAGEGVVDNSGVGGTPPPDFITSALAAVEAVKSLDSGRAAYTGSKWTLNGFAESREALDAMLANLEKSVDGTDWVIFVQVSPQPEAPATAEPEVAEPETPQPEAAEPEAIDPDPVEPAPEPDPAEPAPEPEPVEPAPEPQAMADPDFQFDALKTDGGQIALSGNTPSAAFASYASVISGNGNSDGLIEISQAPEGFINEAVTALRALNTLESGHLSFENDAWSLTGEAVSDEDAASVSATITGLPDGDQWALDLAVMPVFQLCANGVAAFSDSHTILFAPASSNLTAESAAALADLATDLKKCPAANLNVEGHTDTDGPGDSNMALSVARAEAVIAELIALGLDDRRLYAIGYGESLPVATNDTVAGKAQNRRIVFELVR